MAAGVSNVYHRSSAQLLHYNQYNVKVAGRNRAGIANVQAAAINAQIVCYTKAVKESTKTLAGLPGDRVKFKHYS